MSKIICVLLLSLSIAFAQFGKNKVQYERFDWQFISTVNFDIYFHQNGQELAEFTAVELEKSLKHIENQLDYDLKKRIPVIVFNSHNQFQQNNVLDQFFSESVGGVTGLFKNRIVMPFQGSYSQYAHLIGHELVHGVLNDMFHGGSLQASLSQGGYFMPTWMNEGFAEFSSIRGLDTETDMFLRDLALNDNIPELSRINGYLSYRVGQTFYWYVAKEYGEEKVGELINRLNIYKNAESAFKNSFNMTIEEFSEKFKRDIKKLYLPDISKFENPKDYAEEVTNRKKMNNFYNSSPSISPDGEQMAFISEEGGLLGLSVMNIDDMDSKRELISSFRSQDFEDLNILTPGISWNPSGKFIAISAKSGGEDAIYIIDVKKGNYEKYKLGFKSIGSVKWSPDGKKVVFTATKAEMSDIYTYELKTKKVERITNDIFSDKMPVWAPDSRSIYFISDRMNNLNGPFLNFQNMWSYDKDQGNIYKVEVDSKLITRITYKNLYDITSVAVGSDAKNILFVSDKNGISNLYSMNLNSKEITPRTNSLTGLNHISLSPDGSKLLFGTQIDAGYDIFLLKYPLEIKIGLDKLPNTDLRENQLASELGTIGSPEEDEKIKKAEEESDKLISYGDFEIDLEKSESVEPNNNASSYDLNKASVPVDIDTNFIVKDYKVKFSTDYIAGSPGFNTFFGAQGGAQFLFSDVLGDHKIFASANIFLNIQNSNLFVQYSYLPNVIDYTVSAYQRAGFIGLRNPTLPRIDTYRFRDFGLGFGASYPLDLFNRFELNANLRSISKSNIDDVSIPDETNFLVIPEFRFVHDNALGGPWAPSIGSRYFLRAFASPKFGSSGLGFGVFDMDFRQYLPIIDNWLNLAFRLRAGTSFGPDPLTFRMGGVQNWINPTQSFVDNPPFNTPQDFAFMLFEWPMRGFQIGTLEGNSFFLTNIELRFPLFQAVLAGPIPIFIQGIQGSFFLDVGSAFYDEFSGDFLQGFNPNGTPIGDVLPSTGIGIRAPLLGLPVKLDIAWARIGDNWSRPQYLFSFGFDF